MPLTRDEMIEGLKLLLRRAAPGICTRQEEDALRAALAWLQPTTTEEIGAARKHMARGGWAGQHGATLDRALDALAREQSRSMTDEDVMIRQCQSIAALEARLAKIREVLGVEPEETAPLAEVERILRLCTREDRVREALAACTCMCKHVHAAKAALANEATS